MPTAVDTYPEAINSAGDVAGYCYCSASLGLGFLRLANGNITTFSVSPNGI